MRKLVLLATMISGTQALSTTGYSQHPFTATFTVSDKSTASKAFCNMVIRDYRGNSLLPDSTYFWKSFLGAPFPEYPCSGQVSIKLYPGKYYYEADRGPEYFLIKDSFEVIDKDVNIIVSLKRLVDMKSKNWWPGEIHIHRKLKDIETLMLASDLHIAPVITSWNEHFDLESDSIYDPSPKKFDGNRFYTTQGSEDERAGGAILVLNTSRPVDFSKLHDKEYPPLAASIEKVGTEYGNSSWIDIEKPFWWDMPVLIATGKINSIGIAHNHMHKNSIFDNEAWGKERDRNKYPSPMGNGYYTHDIYFKLLNCGLRISPSAGSASGVLPNPVGYNRMYAYVEKGLTYENWFREVQQGKLFVTNGPLLDCKANNQYPGYIFRTGKNIRIAANIYSRDTIDKIEIIRNGTIIKSIKGEEIKGNKISENISFDKSGWFMIRVLCKVEGNFRFAATAPWYVEIGENKKYISRSAAQYFLDWTNKRAGLININDKTRQREIDYYIERAKRFWENLVATANTD